jgi:hypothetical protein
MAAPTSYSVHMASTQIAYNKNAPHDAGRAVQKVSVSDLQLHDVRSLRAALSFHDVEFDTLAFFQGTETLTQNRRVVNEHVVPAFNLDETVALF